VKGARRLLIALGGAILVLALLAGAVVWSGRSLVIIDNRGDAALTVEVSATRAGDFAWSGELKGGQRLFRLATFRGDGAVRAVCRDGEGGYRATCLRRPAAPGRCGDLGLRRHADRRRPSSLKTLSLTARRHWRRDRGRHRPDAAG
jgi:hypothetical protein